MAVASTYRFNYRSSRAKQARIRRFFTPLVVGLLAVCLGVLTITGGLALKSGVNLGWTAIGLAAWLAVLLIWQRWRLRPLVTNAATLNSSQPAIDQLLAADLLGELKWPATPGDWWRLASSQWQGRFVINRLGLPASLVTQLLDQKPDGEVVDAALRLTRDGHHSEIDGGIMVGAILLSCTSLQPLLVELKHEPADIVSVVEWQQRLKQAMLDLKRRPSYGGIGRDWAFGFTPTLSRFATNITREVESGYYRHMPQVHEPVVDQLVNQLSAGRGNAALVGDVGSGKTAIVYSLAERLLQARNTKGLDYHYIMQLNASVLIAAGNQLENTVLQLFAEASHARNIIIFLDEAELFFGSGTGSVDLSKVLLPILQQSNIKLIMAFTPHDWQGLSAHNGALANLIQRLVVTQPTPTDTIKILEDAAIGIEHNSQTTISYPAIKEAYRLAERYLTESAFPGRGITLLEAAANHPDGQLVTANSVQRAVEAMVGAKVVGATGAEKSTLLNLEAKIHERMVNQSHAVKVVSDALRRARAGVRNPSRPIGSFLFLGPTGVGKTELARALADTYFGGQEQIIRLDMSEYQQPKDVDRLLAAGSKSESGSTLISGIRKQPFSVVLFDEIEKANPDILNLLLQLLDEGRLTDSDGRLASFKDAIVICTSNAAANLIRDKIAAGEKLENFQEEITEAVISSNQFRPELINRFDELVLFRPLDKKELEQVVTLLIKQVNQDLRDQRITVELSPAALGWLVNAGYDPRLGARPMRRVVQRVVENVAAERILAGTAKAGTVIKLDDADLAAAAKSDEQSASQPTA